MKFSFITIMVILSATALVACKNENTPEYHEKVIRKSIEEFHSNIISKDKEVQKNSMVNSFISKDELSQLFGANSDKAWPLIENHNKQLIKQASILSLVIKEKGEIKNIKLINIRTEENNSSKDIIKLIPEEIPLYRSVIDYEKSKAGNGIYVLIGGKVKLVKGFKSIYHLINSQ